MSENKAEEYIVLLWYLLQDFPEVPEFVGVQVLSGQRTVFTCGPCTVSYIPQSSLQPLWFLCSFFVLNSQRSTHLCLPSVGIKTYANHHQDPLVISYTRLLYKQPQ